ncbi:MAG: YbaK/EbsC family protein [Pirellulaceae bacterium]
MQVARFLQDRGVGFEVIDHEEAYDAQRVAQAVCVPGREVAKTVLLRADGGYVYVVAVLPATKRIDIEKAAKVLGGGRVEIADEEEITRHCPDCEVGVLPPFGSQYGMQTMVDRSLCEDEEIVFEANTHREAVRMRFDDFKRIEEPLVASFTCG